MIIHQVNPARQRFCHGRVTNPVSLLIVLGISCGGSPARRSAAANPVNDVSISAIQGRGHISPSVGQVLTTGGIVTAVDRNGYYLQDPDGDGDETTSDAVFVFTSVRPGVSAGDQVRIRAQVTEYIPGGKRTGNLSTTQLSRPALLERPARRQALPAPVVLGSGGRIPPGTHLVSPAARPVNLQIKTQADSYPFHPHRAGLDFYESLEGMRVTVPAPVAVSPTRTFGAAGGELFVLPDNGKHSVPPTARTSRGGISLQPHPENRGDHNPEIVQLQFAPDLLPGKVPALAVGDRLGDAIGVMGYDYGSFEVRLTAPLRVEPSGLEPETTHLEGTSSSLTVASYNVLNLSAQEEDAAQRAMLGKQIVHHLRSPDIIALQEIQDDSGEADDGTTDASGTLAALVQAIASAGGPGYRFFEVAPADGRPGGAPGGNIRNAFLYRPDRVRLISTSSLGVKELGRAGIAESLAFQSARDPLVGIFEFRDRRYTLINNHLSSRFGSTPIFGAIQPFVQAGEKSRETQLRALNRHVAHLLAGEPGARIVILGDLNTFEFTDDLLHILPGPGRILGNLLAQSHDPAPYSYIFQGNSQLIDHVFVTPNLLGSSELDLVHINVDFPAPESVEASDHDPLVARFNSR